MPSSRRTFLLTSAAAALSACSNPRLPLAAPEQVAQLSPIFVGTTRALDTKGWPTDGPGNQLRRFSVPILERFAGGPVLVARTVEDTPRGQPSVFPRKADFVRALRDRARALGTREALIFVHGYNNTIDDSLARAAQMARTFAVPVVPVHFAWASVGAALAYVADRDAVLSARDSLEELFGDIHAAGLRPIVLAHSMGAQLTIEAFRQMSIGKNPTLASIGGVFLVAPDIDVDLFRTQMLRIANPPQPFVVLTNRKDRALALARGLGGRRERLGSLADPAPLADFRITLVDATAVANGGDHFPVGSSPALAGLLRDFARVPSAFEDPASVQDLLAGTVVGVRSITQVVLDPVGL